MRFHDRSKRLTYLKLEEMMRRAAEDESLITDARDFVTRFMLPDPSQQAYGQRWLSLLDLPVDKLAEKLLADTPEGDLLRDTAPVFGQGLTAREVAELLGKVE